MKWHLRPWELSDVPSIALYANDPAIAANLRNIFPYPYTRRDAEVFIGGCMAGDETLQLCVLSVWTVTRRAVLGFSAGKMFTANRRRSVTGWLAPIGGKGL